jgi:tetratricopeptide (TPR) repeat protein
MIAAGHPRDLRPSAPPNTPGGSADDLLERARRARRAGRLDEAAALFAAAVQQTPTDSEALTGLADVNEAQGATALAIASYRRALAVNPRYLPARLGLADSLWASGQRDEARAAYRSIVAQVPPSLCPDVARQRAAMAVPSASP